MAVQCDASQLEWRLEGLPEQVTGAEAFKLLDKNNDGRLDKEDLISLVWTCWMWSRWDAEPWWLGVHQEFEKALQEQLEKDKLNTANIEELRQSDCGCRKTLCRLDFASPAEGEYWFIS